MIDQTTDTLAEAGEPAPLLSAADVESEFGISPVTLFAWQRAGRILAVNVGRSTLYPRFDVEQAIRVQSTRADETLAEPDVNTIASLVRLAIEDARQRGYEDGYADGLSISAMGEQA